MFPPKLAKCKHVAFKLCTFEGRISDCFYIFSKMSGFDEGEVLYSDVFGSEDQLDQNQLTRTAAQKKFKKFIRDFHEGTFVYPYR